MELLWGSSLRNNQIKNWHDIFRRNKICGWFLWSYFNFYNIHWFSKNNHIFLHDIWQTEFKKDLRKKKIFRKTIGETGEENGGKSKTNRNWGQQDDRIVEW